MESSDRTSGVDGDPPEYRTTDLDLASFLATRGFQPLRAEAPPPNTFPRFAAFVFQQTPDLDEAASEWARDDPLTVDLCVFLDRRREFYQWARSVVRGGGR